MHKNNFDIVMAHIEENVNQPTAQIKKEIANLIGRHSRAFDEHFQILTGYTLDYYIKQRRLNYAARDLVRHQEKSICDIALEYQFSDQSAFTRAIKAKYGVTPNEIRKEWLWVFEERFCFDDFTGKKNDTEVAKLLRSMEIGGPNNSFELDLMLEIEQMNDIYGFDIDTCRGMQQVQEISDASIMKQLALDESEWSDMVSEMRVVNTGLRKEKDAYQEINRILLRENLDLRDTLKENNL